MSKVISKPFREAHADLFQGAAGDDAELKQALPMLVTLGQMGQCNVNLLDGRVLYIGGYAETAPGVAECFIYPSIWATKYPKSFYAEAKWWVQHLKSQHRRVQCWGEDTELSRRWLSHLGFVYEGALRSYTQDGKSMLVWGLV